MINARPSPFLSLSFSIASCIRLLLLSQRILFLYNFLLLTQTFLSLTKMTLMKHLLNERMPSFSPGVLRDRYSDIREFQDENTTLFRSLRLLHHNRDKVRRHRILSLSLSLEECISPSFASSTELEILMTWDAIDMESGHH